MNALKFSYFQLTFGQEETYLHPEKTGQNLQRPTDRTFSHTPSSRSPNSLKGQKRISLAHRIAEYCTGSLQRISGKSHANIHTTHSTSCYYRRGD